MPKIRLSRFLYDDDDQIRDQDIRADQRLEVSGVELDACSLILDTCCSEPDLAPRCVMSA